MPTSKSDGGMQVWTANQLTQEKTHSSYTAIHMCTCTHIDRMFFVTCTNADLCMAIRKLERIGDAFFKAVSFHQLWPRLSSLPPMLAKARQQSFSGPSLDDHAI